MASEIIRDHPGNKPRYCSTYTLSTSQTAMAVSSKEMFDRMIHSPAKLAAVFFIGILGYVSIDSSLWECTD